jgi:hypothetical protein
MDEVEVVLLLEPGCLPESGVLPEQIVESDPTLSPGGIPGVLPAWQRDPHKMQLRIRMLSQEALDIVAVDGMANHPHVVVGRELPSPIPRDARFGAKPGTAGVTNQKHLERMGAGHVCHPSAQMPTIASTGSMQLSLHRCTVRVRDACDHLRPREVIVDGLPRPLAYPYITLRKSVDEHP